MSEKVNKNKRKILLASTGFVGAIGGAGIGGSLLVSMSPSEKAKAAGAPVEVDISKIKPGTLQTVEWRGKPVWILNRTKEMMKSVEKENPRIEDPESKVPMQPKYAQNKYRSIKPNFLVLIGICTHLGCSPTEKLDAGLSSGLGSDWDGGFYCPCHGSKFDLAGRVFKGVPAPVNLEVPPHTFTSENQLVIGIEKKEA